jgi:hypothetical protein
MPAKTDNGQQLSSKPHLVYPAARRWADLVIAVLSAMEDPRTLGDWARGVHMSEPALRAACYMAGARPRSALSLARLLRALSLAPSAGCAPSALLDVRDERTLKALIRQIDAERVDRQPRWPTPRAFLDAQTLVTDPHALETLKDSLERWCSDTAAGVRTGNL